MAETLISLSEIKDYCVIDTETTGIVAGRDEIIEVGIVRVRNNEIVDRYSKLFKPKKPLTWMITSITGITNQMLKNAKHFEDLKQEVIDFISGDILIGHNVTFDIRFINSYLEPKLENSHLDTLKYARRYFDFLPNHKLVTLVNYFELSQNTHRALDDVISTKELFDILKKEKGPEIYKNSILIEETQKFFNFKTFLKQKKKRSFETKEELEKFWKGKRVVFGEKFYTMSEMEALQIVNSLGAIPDSYVRPKIDILILGMKEYWNFLECKISPRLKKVLELNGDKIEIISEAEFQKWIK
ncbi:exonuclease domain-containing protein [Mycoplasma procyoni]|uniref:exonuclease domain-containing protein n=1 Tax=Mycoplasma procyoni TaxID=568784 RepID=UPI00197C46FB|nr:exonuclease domain-containing protein [Mycoplasma procyoni]MBN3534390.1 3'-5' exoribonuclease [Mycoplasma procyoni]